MERKLASIQRITSLEPIEGANRIEKATILGWQLVVRKGEFNVGDPAVFMEIDSMIPDKPEYAFLKSSGHVAGDPVCRLRTRKFKRTLSQGLAMPLGAFSEFDVLSTLPLGSSVAGILGIIKYEPPERLTRGDTKGVFPHFIPKTDEIRIQSAPELIDEFQGVDVYISTKCDGTSATYYLRDGEFGVCSRNWAKKDGDNIYWRVAHRYGIEEELRKLGDNIAIQGEICGPGIQKNRMQLPEPRLFCYNVYDIGRMRYRSYVQFRLTISALSLTPVPDIICDTFTWDLPTLLTMAEGKYHGSKYDREGIVIRPTKEGHSAVLDGRASFKVVNNRYLLKGGD